jgi:hypothetical protein
MQQTATEWLFEKLWETPIDKFSWYALLEKAKEMEKEQIYKALCRGHSDCGVFTMISECEQYYNETYKQHNQIT